MKKILIKILFALLILQFCGISISSNTYADAADAGAADATSHVTIIVTESIPGIDCDDYPDPGFDSNNPLYECKIEPGFDSMVILLGSIIKYFTYFASLGAVLFIIINGIMYSMGGADPSLKDDAKNRIAGTLKGLILLLLSGIILNLVAPWFFEI